MPSFNLINYYLRTNKNIERKLFFESLKIMDNIFDISGYRYLGFGSIWFVDFLIAHKLLGIEDMVSIEKDIIGYSRANFNKPFNCIILEKGESVEVIPDMDFTDKPIIAWLDYDSYLASSTAMPDIQLLCERVLSGSIILITIDANYKQLRSRFESSLKIFQTLNEILENEESQELQKIYAIKQYIDRVGISDIDKKKLVIEKIAGNFVPTGLSRSDLQNQNFPNLLSRILFNKFEHAMIVSGREEKFYPLYNFSYRDTTPMISVGGMVASRQDAIKLERSHIRLKRYITGERQYEIKVPPLTLKEKIALDQMLPSERLLGIRKVKKVLQVELEKDQLAAYQKFYIHYPVYGEIEL